MINADKNQKEALIKRFNKVKAVTAALLLFFAFLPLCAEESSFEKETESFALDISFGGKVETVHGLRLQKPFDYIASRNFASFFVQANAGASSAKISAGAEYNYRNAGRTGFRLNEAYFRYAGDIFELTAGRQIIAWGQADGFVLTNLFSAKDKSEFTAIDSDSMELGTDGIKIKFLHDFFEFEAVAVPFFTPHRIPLFHFEEDADNRAFAVQLPKYENNLPISYTKEKAVMPRKFLDTEAGARFSFFLPAMDFSFSGFYGWDKIPRFTHTGFANKKLIDPSQPPNRITNRYVPVRIHTNLMPEYYRIGMAGFDAAIPAGEVVLRFETAWVGGRYFAPKEFIAKETEKNLIEHAPDDAEIIFNKQLRKNQVLILAGIDWTHSSWFVSAQYFEDLVPDHKNELERGLHNGAFSLNISKTFLRETLKLAVRGVIGVNYGDTFSTYSLDYALTDNLHLALGADVYTKGYEGKGSLGELNKLTAAWIKGTFTF